MAHVPSHDYHQVQSRDHDDLLEGADKRRKQQHPRWGNRQVAIIRPSQRLECYHTHLFRFQLMQLLAGVVTIFSHRYRTRRCRDADLWRSRCSSALHLHRFDIGRIDQHLPNGWRTVSLHLDPVP